ncbi:hypothetical protein HQ535_11905 [bacterium]|nr:hypothetical protein [bacterium]
MNRRTRGASTAPVECSQCGASDAIQIELTVSDEQTILFNSCHRCEHRWWMSDGSAIDITGVLDLVRKT